MSDRIGFSLDGLGMDRKAMLELVNRLNKADDRKWVLATSPSSMVNQINPFFLPYQQQCALNG